MDNTDVSNAALGHIGAKRIADFDDTSEPNPQTIYCRLYLEKARDALIRSHLWRFAKKRLILKSTGDVVFEWDNSFQLPSDFLRPLGIYDGSDTPTGQTTRSYELEGTTLLMNTFRTLRNVCSIIIRISQMNSRNCKKPIASQPGNAPDRQGLAPLVSSASGLGGR